MHCRRAALAAKSNRKTPFEEQGVSIDSSELMAHVHGGDVSFFGKPLHLVDAHYVMQQIKEIAECDDRLSVEGNVLNIGNVGFGINIHGCSLSLLSSVQVDDPEMGKVVEYLNSLYGAAEVDNSENYYWYVGADGEYKGRLVARMRPLHSDEGHTGGLPLQQGACGRRRPTMIGVLFQSFDYT